MKIRNRIVSLILAMVLLVGAIPMNAFAAGDIVYGIGYVTGSNVRLRSESNTDSKIVDNTGKGEVVVVLGKSDDWYKVIYDLKEGYIHSDYLNVSTTGNAELGYGKVTASAVKVRSGAGTSHSEIDKAKRGEKAYIVGIKDGWYRVIFDKSVGYIRSDYLELTEVPYENGASRNTPKFFRGGKSTGIEVSASALNGSSGSSSSSSSSASSGSSASASSSSSASKGIMYGIGFVTGSGLRLRDGMSTGAKTLDTASKNEVVVIISKHGDWYKVIYDLQEGYMHKDYLDVSTVENAELGYGKVTASAVKVRSGAGTSYSEISKAKRGEKAYIVGLNNGWYRVIFGNSVGYIRSDYLELTEVPCENKASSKSPKFFRGGKSTGTEVSASALNGSTGTSSGSSSSGSSSSSSSSTGTAAGNKIVATAKQYLGVPYKWGGTDPSGFDCSGFVYYVLRCNGINVSRTQNAMYAEGTPVSKSNLKPGDLVFFQNTYKAGLSHVGIYVGDGQFIHAPSSGKVVSYANLYTDYYIEHYYGAARYTK